ncbi:MAG TPA: flagellin, partial [Candidatus Acidoferrum sp.]|nr:flagellin [Candidatus Acidoferrum sp.]
GQQPREILEGVSLRANVTGTEVFSQSVDLFQTLITLRDALRANNTQSISSSLTGLKTGISQVTAALGSVGSRVQRVNAIHETLTTDIARLKSLQSRIEDTDMAATTLDYQQQQTLYQASLQMGARMIQSSLLDFLR